MTKTPRYSYRYGYPDEGISEYLGKSKGFRYSDRFLKWWYTELEAKPERVKNTRR